MTEKILIITETRDAPVGIRLGLHLQRLSRLCMYVESIKVLIWQTFQHFINS